MSKRSTLISKSILTAIFHDPKKDERTLLTALLAFFSFFNLRLARYKAALFQRLRSETWEIDEEGYKESFRADGKDDAGLRSVGDLGYSGSVCITSPRNERV